MANSQAYETARAVHSEALRVYAIAVAAYRAMKMTDQEFLAARAIKVQADKAFDLAFEAEANREEPTQPEEASPQEPLF